MNELLLGSAPISIGVGLAVLALGGYLVVGGGVGLAKALRISPLVIGVVFLGFGTSLPEMLVSVRAALADSPGVSIGNVVGSNIANLLLIAGVGAAIMHAAISPRVLLRDGLFVLLTSAALATLLVRFDRLDATIGLGLLGALLLYIIVALSTGRLSEMEEVEAPWTDNLLLLLLVFGLGVGATVVGAQFLVVGAVALATQLGASETLVGLTIVAIGTSLPELAATIAAALRRQPEMAVGNVLGSNVFNVCAIIGVTAIIKPIDIPPDVDLDLAAMLLGTLLFLLLARSRGALSRREGVILLLCYLGYVAVTVMQSDWGRRTLGPILFGDGAAA